MRKTGYIFCLFGLLANPETFGQTSCLEAVVQGIRYQIQADSMQRRVEAQVLALPAAHVSQKDSMKTAISDDEAKAVALQKKANEYFSIIIPENVETRNTHVSEFAILPKSPYSTANPIPVGNPLPDGVVYKIQLGAFSRPLPANAFKGLSPLSGEKSNNGVVRYYAGFFSRFDDAGDALRKVHQYGFKDAYIVAFYNRKMIHPERAKQLENFELRIKN